MEIDLDDKKLVEEGKGHGGVPSTEMETHLTLSAAPSFTPGPWTLKTVQTSVGSCHTVGPFPSAGVHKETNACIYADRFTADEREGIAGELYANALLIAAAPALYEACKTMVESLNGSPTNFAGMLAAHRKIDAAIAMAEGKQ